MCLGRESLEGPHLCGVAEQVFAALPWPCLVWTGPDRRSVMVNDAFRREFGLGSSRVGPRWLETHFPASAEGPDGEFVYRHAGARATRYSLMRQVLDAPEARFEAVYLMPSGEPLHDEPLAAPSPLPPTMTGSACRPDVNLTPRESQVLDGIMEGKLNKVIAGDLCISPKTVELHRANLMAKLRVHNVVELARVVLDSGMGRVVADAEALEG